MLSIEKLISFITLNMFQVCRVFVREGYVHILELQYIGSMSPVHIVLNSKYKFKPLSTMKIIEITESIDNPDFDRKEMDDYLYSTDNITERSYSVNTKFHISDITKHLSDVYKHNTITDETEKKRTIYIKNVCRTLHRLKYCVKNTPFGITVLSNTVFGSFVDGKCSVFITHEPLEYNTYINIHFKYFFDNIRTVGEDCERMGIGILDIMKQNRNTHAYTMSYVIEQQHDMLTVMENINRFQNNTEILISKYIDLLNDLRTKRKVKETELSEYDQHGFKIHIEIKNERTKHTIQQELQDMATLETEILMNLSDLRQKLNHVIHVTDRICFDNIIMMDNVLKNCKSLNEIQREIQ